MFARRRLQQFAVAISIFSVFYNTAEGVVSVVFGAESGSRALVFYGLQSAVEVVSALLVTWRLVGVARPGDESAALSKTSPQIVRIERIATLAIGTLLVALALAALGTSIASLVLRDRPSTALPSLLIAATATLLMAAFYLAKRFLARALDSSVLHGEALCTLTCMQLSLVLFVGSLVYRFWHAGWWVDAATACAIGALFGWEGTKMIRWARNAAFDGGCCADCHATDGADQTAVSAVAGATTPAVETEKPGEPGQIQEVPCAVSARCCGCSKTEVPGNEGQACSSLA